MSKASARRVGRRRLAGLTIAALGAVPVLSGCHTSPGAAAVIGSQQVTVDQLQSQVSSALADPNVKRTLSGQSGQSAVSRADFTRQTLGRLVDERLVSAVAAAHHVTVTPQQVKAQQASFVQQAGSLAALQQSAAQQVGVGAKQLPELIRYTVLQQNLGTALTASLPASHSQLLAEYRKDIDSFDQLQIAQIAVQSKSLARRILHTVRQSPSSFASQARKYSLDTQTKANGGLVGLVGRSRVVQLLGGKTASVKPGTFTVVKSASDYVVLHIIRRQVQPLSAVLAKVKAALFASQANTLLGKAIAAESKKLGVHVNPRYGRWDSSTQTVVASPSPVSSSG